MNLSRFTNKLLVLLLLSFPISGYCQLVVTPGISAAVLASTLAGPGVTIINPTLTCPAVANGSFTATGTLLGMSRGILLTCGHAAAAAGPYGPPPGTASFNNGAAGDPSLTAILGAATYDACVLQFDVIARGDSIGFNYQFGSQEYYSGVCTRYNDIFAFFISGTGIVGAPNMALIPGTTIPVEINTVNNGIPGSSGGSLPNCTSVGAGSPFTAYYIDNTGGTRLAYKGFTTKFRAVHAVTPCDTYHLKLAIADGGNAIYDSGVFLEAASLSTGNFSFNHADSIGSYINGVDHTIVKGCSPATITILSTDTSSSSREVYFTYSGTGIRGVDYSAPDSASIARGADSAVISIAGIPTPPGGAKTVKIYLSTPASCGIIDSVLINIIDTPTAVIVTPDTTVCSGSTFQIMTSGTTGLSYTWTPATGLSSAIVSEPFATPTVTTTYTMSATLPGSGCPPLTRDITVSIINTTISILTPPTSICEGGSVALAVSGSPTLLYVWSPTTGLSNPSIAAPTASPSVTTTYTLTAIAPGGACRDTASITISVVSALNVSILTPDTTICTGASFTIRTSGAPGPSYNWTPADGLSSATDIQPVATPTVTTNYLVVASWPGSGCPTATDSVLVSVIDVAATVVTGDQSICVGTSVDLSVTSTDPGLVYNWTPTAGLDNATIPNPVATPTVTTLYSVTATDSSHTCFSGGAVLISVTNLNVTLLTPDTVVCKGNAVQLEVIGNPDLTYSWSPAAGISNPDIMDPFASPAGTTTYTLSISAPGAPCTITDTVTVGVIDAHLTNVSTDQTIPYGSSIQLNADNSLFYMWSPDDGTLNNQNINNPVARPLQPTTYFVTALDAHGCRSADSVTIHLSYDQVFIPDAFTPNNDGLNDYFRVVNLGYYKLVSMNIYDRWGVLVYHVTNGENNGWDGKYNGSPADLGTYNYFIIIGQPDGTEQAFKGTVTLIR